MDSLFLKDKHKPAARIVPRVLRGPCVRDRERVVVSCRAHMAARTAQHHTVAAGAVTSRLRPEQQHHTP